MSLAQAGTATARDDRDDDEAPIDPARRSALLQDCSGMVVSRLSGAIAEALKKVGDDLTALALRNRDPAAQQALLDAVTLVRRHHADIEVRFREMFADIFARRIHGDDDGPSDAPTGGLALVDDSVIEEKIAIDRIIQRARSKLDPDEVLGIRARLGFLAAGDWFDEDNHPAAPEAVFEALRRTLAQLNAEAGVRDALLDAIEPHVSSNLGAIYTSVNERLRSNHVLPRIRPQVVTAKAQARRAKAAQPPLPAQDSAAPAPVLAPAADPAIEAVPAGEDPFALLAARLADGTTPARFAAARLLANPASFGAGKTPPAVESGLLDSLHAIQAGCGESGAGGPRLLDEMLEKGRTMGSPLDQLTVEIVSLVFDHLYADRRLPDTVKQQLLRLQVVAVKAALIDRSFFASRRHPMRRLLDEICRAASDPDADVGPDSALVGGVAEIVDWLLASFESDLSVFEDAAMRLDLLLSIESQRRMERDAALARQAERLEALALAQEQARAEIRARAGESAPAFMVDFLDRSWYRVMAMLRVEDGDEAWRDALACIDALVWSVQPKESSEIPRLASLLPKLIAELNRGLARAGVDKSDQERFFNELLERHGEVIQRAKAGAAGPASRPPTFAQPVEPPREAAASRPAEPPVSPEIARQLGDLRRGDTLELLEPDGARRRLRISWVSPTRRLFVLTRHPEVARPVERAELARWLATGRVRLADAETAIERTIATIAAGKVAPPA